MMRRAALLCFTVAVGCTTTVAVGDEISTQWISPWRYVSEFFDRQALYRQWSREACAGATTVEQQVIQVLQWTTAAVAPQPADRPAIDDHIANVVRRGYGAGYQRAEVFTTLMTALGPESRWGHAATPDGTPVQLAFVETPHGWVVVDVTHGTWFEADGRLATIEDVERSGRFQNLYEVEARNYTRAHGQFFWDRIRLMAGVAPSQWTAPIRSLNQNSLASRASDTTSGG